MKWLFMLLLIPSVAVAADVVLGSLPNSTTAGSGTDVVIVFATTSTTTTTTTIPFSPLIYYAFDEDLTNLVLNAGSGANGSNSVAGAAPTWVAEAGGISSHMSYDGTDWTYTDFRPNYDNVTQNFTVAYWTYLDGWSGGGSTEAVFGRVTETGATDARTRFRFRDTDTGHNLFLRASGGSAQRTANDSSASEATWVHYCYVHDGGAGTGTGYKNGVAFEVDSTVLSGVLGTSDQDFWVGGLNSKNSLSEPLFGKVDEFWYKEVALTSNQVLTLSQDGAAEH